MKKISVIIPLYNSENYIRQCIYSVTGQSHQNLEIIVVDDGSTDNSAAVCGKLAEEDGRILLCRQENRGVSAARNHGIDVATGEYVFFLDSDDAIHPLLLGELLGWAEENRAQLAFCGYRKTDSCRMETVLAEMSGLAGTEADGEIRGEELLQEDARKRSLEEELREGAGKTSLGEGLRESAGKTSLGEELPESARKAERGTISEKDTQGRWLTADEAGTEEWFHVKYTDTFSGIGGKLILREAIGNLRFDRELTNGEDTFFLYQLVRRRVRSVFCLEEWYYYRVHGQSVTNSAGTARGMRYFESARRIRDGEYESGHADHAMRWEILVIDQIRRNYAAQKSRDAGKALSELRRIAAAERRHPMFRRICFSDRVLFVCCFACYPVYVILNRIVLFLANRRSR